MTERPTQLSPESTLALASSLGLPLEPERALLVSGVLHHIRTVISRIDELPVDVSNPPAFAFDSTRGRTSC